MISPIVENWLPPTTKEGWRQFVDYEPPERPDPKSEAELKSLSRVNKEAFDQERREFVASLPPMPARYELLQKNVRKRITLNRSRKPIARRGIAVDGGPNNGKSTALTEIGREYERECRRQWPHELTPDGHEFIPVVYANIATNETIKQLSKTLVSFYSAVPYRADSGDLTQLLLKYAAHCQTSLFLFDEIHNLQLSRTSDVEANNYLKSLANSSRATFIYAGVNLLGDGFFNEGHGKQDASRSQIRYRFSRFPLEPIGMVTDEDKRLFIGILKGYETELELANSRPGDLVNLATYLSIRTKGMIGALDQCLREAYVDAIDDGIERITREILDEVEIDGLTEV